MSSKKTTVPFAGTKEQEEELKKIIDDEFDELDKYLEDADFDTSYLKELLLKLKER